jgi:hypothetical protein
LKQESIRFHFPLNACDIGSVQFVRRIRHFKKHALEMVKRGGHHGIVSACQRLAVEPVIRKELPRFGLKGVGLKGVSLKRAVRDALVSSGMTEFDKQALRPIEMIVEDEENYALLCQGWIRGFHWDLSRPLPVRSSNEGSYKRNQTCAGDDKARQREPGGPGFRRVSWQRRLD